MTSQTELELRLREDLRARQDAVSPAPADLADRVRHRHRSQRRAQLLTAVAAVAVVSLFAGVATLVENREAEVADDPSGSANTILDWPTRGSLADDEEFLEGMRRLDWDIPFELVDDIPEPPVDHRQVAFAGDISSYGQVALVVGQTDGGGTVAAWFTGYPGATPEEMQLVNLPEPVQRTSAQGYVGKAWSGTPATVLVVVAAPEATLEMSALPTVDAAGVETQEWVPLPSTDGTYADAMDPIWGLTGEVRSSVQGEDWSDVPLLRAIDESVTQPSGPMTDESMVEQAMNSIGFTYGLMGGDLEPRVLASGISEQGRGVLIGITFPSGATGAWLLDYDLRPDGAMSLGRLPHAPAGTPLDERLISVPVGSYRIAVSAPTSAVRVEALTEDGVLLGSVDLVEGSYLGPVPGGYFAPSTGGAATVRAVDAAGNVVTEEPIGRLVAE